MRLDLFLKVSRLCGRRPLAQKLCDAGRVLLNGKPAKSSHAVKVGDEILLKQYNKETKARVLSVPTARQTSRKDASTLYQLLSEGPIDEDEL
jgi:ribosomal 50S subunit-recycling heat shock protein